MPELSQSRRETGVSVSVLRCSRTGPWAGWALNAVLMPNPQPGCSEDGQLRSGALTDADFMRVFAASPLNRAGCLGVALKPDWPWAGWALNAVLMPNPQPGCSEDGQLRSGALTDADFMRVFAVSSLKTRMSNRVTGIEVE
jgi:hypothetical protein